MSQLRDNNYIYTRTKEKDKILQILRENGFRITKQRKLILDVILKHECACCKEIYYQANKMDPSIGIATVYRMINTLGELEILKPENSYKIPCEDSCCLKDGCQIVMKNNDVIHLDWKEWEEAIGRILMKKGYMKKCDIDSIIVKTG